MEDIVMCKAGDIILINNYEHNGKRLNKHSFVVLSDEKNQIQGLDYDLICNVISSFHDEAHKAKKLSFPGNFPITAKQTLVKNNREKDGYIKAEQLYYFNKEKIDFIVIGSMDGKTFELLLDFIEALEIDIEQIVDKL